RRVARRLHEGVFVGGTWQLPGAVAEDELAAQAFQRVDGLRRLLARSKDQDLRLGHGDSVVGCRGTGRFVWCREIAVGAAAGSVELYSTILEHSIPTVQLFAHESLEFLRRAADRADARFLEFVGDDGIGIYVDDFALDIVDDGARRAGRRHQPDPGRNVVERRNAGFDRERSDLRQSRQRTAVELGKGAQFAALDEREAGGGAVDDVVDRAGQETLHRGRAAVERNVLHVEAGLAIEQIAGKARREDPGPVVELAGTGFGARDQLFDGLRPILRANVQQRRVLGRERDRGKVLERII